mmetsp:Transcript_30602/g.31836  ORF Transcript_30602/g.31836 Transcript_30602/m.31836 type:complete len:107 (-) Transcript_30602:26-346(-)
MIIYCLMRLNGENKDSAREILERMKKMRRNCIGDYSLEFAEKFLVPYLLGLKSLTPDESLEIDKYEKLDKIEKINTSNQKSSHKEHLNLDNQKETAMFKQKISIKS